MMPLIEYGVSFATLNVYSNVLEHSADTNVMLGIFGWKCSTRPTARIRSGANDDSMLARPSISAPQVEPVFSSVSFHRSKPAGAEIDRSSSSVPHSELAKV